MGKWGLVSVWFGAGWDKCMSEGELLKEEESDDCTCMRVHAYAVRCGKGRCM